MESALVVCAILSQSDCCRLEQGDYSPLGDHAGLVEGQTRQAFVLALLGIAVAQVDQQIGFPRLIRKKGCFNGRVIKTRHRASVQAQRACGQNHIAGLQRAIADGYTRNVVVLTRNRGYRKDTKDIRIPSFVYRKYPKLREALSRRCAVYNKQLEMVEQMEDEGKIIVIRPQKPVMVDRIERDVQKLTEFYEEGYDCARNLFEF